MGELVSIQDAKMGEWRDVPTGQLRTTYFLTSPIGSQLPQCFRVENSPNRCLESHFHAQDQFQVIVQGSGTLGKHALSPYVVHFSRAFTPYGPIVAGPTGLAWLTLRMQRDEGAQYMTQSREVLLSVKDRAPWQMSEAVSFTTVPDNGAVHALKSIRDERGLSVFAVRLKPGASLLLPDPSATGGQFFVVVGGGVKQGSKEIKSLSTMLNKAQVGPVSVTAGSQGLEALVLNFPFTALTQKLIVPPPAAEGVKVWHCEPCGFLYNESEGLPEKGAPAGTRFEDLPIGWHGPDCDAGKVPFLEVSF